MTPLRQRMLDAMTVRGLAERTKECYTEAISRMARHYRRNPELLSAQEVEAYLLHLVRDRHLSYSSVNHAASASRFLFETVLGRKPDELRPPMARVPQKQPHLLAREEIARLFGCCAHPVHRTVLQTIYAAGLRVSQACALRVADIDSAADRMCVRVNAGTAIGNERIRATTPTQVAFTVRADDHGGKKPIRLEGTEFIGRLMLHVLPTGIKRIRYYGVLAAACKGAKLDAARQALQMPALNLRASESARDFMARVARTDVLQCPCCKLGRLRCLAQFAASRHLPAPGSPMMPANRGPP